MKIPGYLRNEFVYDPLSKIHSVLATSDLESQHVRLARLRAKSNFCLIILDACRYDFLDAAFDTFFLGEYTPTRAVGLNTFEYIRYLWPEVYEYPYVTAAAPVTSQRFDFREGEQADGLANDGAELFERYCGYVPDNHFDDLVEVWRDSWDEDLGVCPPEPVTERAIDISETTKADRLVVHYFQPHGPFIGNELESGNMEGYDSDVRGGAVEKGIWSAARSGKISKERLRGLYRSNLDRALSAVAELVRETDYERYVIMGDHGEALGEYNMYYHGIEHPKVRTIPWAIIDGVRDDAPRMWEYTRERTVAGETTASRLRELGYIE